MKILVIIIFLFYLGCGGDNPSGGGDSSSGAGGTPSGGDSVPSKGCKCENSSTGDVVTINKDMEEAESECVSKGRGYEITACNVKVSFKTKE